MQWNKNIKIFLNYFLGPLLFIWLAFSIYREIDQQPRLQESWLQINASFHSYKIVYLVIALLLIFANWGLEALKWKLSIASIYRIGFWQSFWAVLSGVTFSVTMPNRIGDYFGRVLYMPDGMRLKTISVTLVGSFAQLITTLIMGVTGLVVIKHPLLIAYPRMLLWYQFLLYGLIALILLLLLIYFNTAAVTSVFGRWFSHKKYGYLVEALRDFDTRLLSRVLLLSVLRYTIFLIQYIMLFYLFGVNVSVATIGWVMSVVFLAMAIIPSIALVEVGMRGEISLKLMGLFSANSLGIGLTSITIWFINLVVPAIIGSLLMLNLKLFKKRNERI
ncbi:MAG TPA: lysylphosphatidylglycerol synthase domain-containing protein [Flavisolibacter sp.]|jgi:hypothetical protein|nr:lysylphosphatidylglycerol synthase domain-containing protein [Flavisolibacter sp.]